MRTAIIALLLAVGFAVNETDQQLGGCKLRCRKLTFIGEGSVPVKPNWALVDLSVEVSSSQLQSGSSNISNDSGGQMGDAMKVRDEAKHRAEFILNYLKDLKQEEIKDFSIDELSLRPDYSMEDDGDRKFIGYKATFGLKFKVKLTKFQEVLDHIISESGANRVDSVVFVADEELEKSAYTQAIQLATSNAWEQAQAIQKVLGIQGNLKLLSVRDKLLPTKKLVRRFARRLLDRLDMNPMDNEGGWDMDSMETPMLGFMGQGESLINALLVFQFDFEDGTISFKPVERVESNATIQDILGPFLSNQSTTTPMNETQPPAGTTLPTQPVNTVTPVLNATNQPNETIVMRPGENTAGPVTTNQPQTTTAPVNPP